MLKHMSKRVFIKKDFWIGILIIVFGIVMFTQANSSDPVNDLYPKFVFGISIVIGILTSVVSIVKANSISVIKDLKFFSLEITLILLLILTVSFIKLIGFYTCIFISTFILFLILKHSHSVKTVVKSLLYSFGLTVIAYFGFTTLLGIRLPIGLFI